MLGSRIFEEIIMETAVGDRLGRDMWKKSFSTKDGLRESVQWREFLIALSDYFKKALPKDAEDLRYKCLHILLVKNNEVVTIEDWSRLLDWFGPMENLDQLFERILALLRQPWFHGDMSSDLAEKSLRKQKKGFFLVRFSSTDAGCYAITSLAKDGKLKHYKIVHKPGQPYMIGKIEASTLDEIVTKYRKDLYLKHPCPGSPFTYLFDPHKASNVNETGYNVESDSP